MEASRTGATPPPSLGRGRHLLPRAGPVGVSWLFRCQGLLVSPGQLHGGEGGAHGEPRGAGLRPAGPEQADANGSNSQPQRPANIHFPSDHPSWTPGSEFPLSPARLHGGDTGPKPPTQSQGCPAPWPPPGSAVAPCEAQSGTLSPHPGWFLQGTSLPCTTPLPLYGLLPCAHRRPSRAALPPPRSPHIVGAQERAAERWLCPGQ